MATLIDLRGHLTWSIVSFDSCLISDEFDGSSDLTCKKLLWNIKTSYRWKGI